MRRRPTPLPRASLPCFRSSSERRGPVRRYLPATARLLPLDKATAEKDDGWYGQAPLPAHLRNIIFLPLPTRQNRRLQLRRAVSLSARFPFGKNVPATKSDARIFIVVASPLGAPQSRDCGTKAAAEPSNFPSISSARQSLAPPEKTETCCQAGNSPYLSRPMPKPVSRSKTKKAVRKRFKITASGKVLRSQSSRRHLMSSKTAKRKRHLSKMAGVDPTDVARIKANLPFG